MNEVELISISKPIVSGLETAEDLVAYCARVSNPENQLNTKTSDRLLKYLIKHKHWSPFEMVHLTLEINTTRDIARQILRHRSFSFQEFSQRYAEPSEFGNQFTFREARLQDNKNRQNSIFTDDEKLQEEWKIWQEKVIDMANKSYDWAIENNIAKEQARSVLPEGCTKTRLYMAGSLRSWIHYCDLRMDNGTQLEHQEIAKKCWDIVKSEFPSLSELINYE